MELNSDEVLTANIFEDPESSQAWKAITPATSLLFPGQNHI